MPFERLGQVVSVPVESAAGREAGNKIVTPKQAGAANAEELNMKKRQ